MLDDRVGRAGRRSIPTGWAAALLSLLVHGAALLILLWASPTVRPTAEREPIVAHLAVLDPPPLPAASVPRTPSPAAPTSGPAPIVAARRPVAPRAAVRASPPVDEGDGDAEAPAVTDAQLAGASVAGTGGAGGGEGGACDMAARVQAALRKDPLVRAAAVAAPPTDRQALWVWNGDWVRGKGEEGKGLAAVREAILWEVAFAPAPCRAEPVRGLVLLALDAPRPGLRLLLGTGTWRWSDLVAVPRGGDAER